MSKKNIQIEPVFIKYFPNYDLAPAQMALYNETKWRHKDKKGAIVNKPLVDELFLFIARQTMKSKTVSTIFWDRLLHAKNKEWYIAMSPLEKDIEDLLISDIFLEAFGGSNVVEDINSIYIKAPKEFEDKMVKDWSKDKAYMEQWLNNSSNANQWAIYRENDTIDSQDLYFKLFRENISGANNASFKGTLFNGAIILCVSSGYTFGDKIRGKKIKGVYGEELGQYPYNPFSAIMPAIISQEGWVMFAGTPPEEEDSWVYEDVWTKIMDTEGVRYEKKFGLEWHYAIKKTEIPPTFEDLNNGIEKKYKIRNQLNCVGRLEDLFPYIYKGAERFAEIQSCREYPAIIKPKRNSFNKPILDKSSVIKDSKGNVIFPGFFEYDIEISTKKNPGVPLFTEERYAREYQMNFIAGSENVFDRFSPSNILRREDFSPEYYHTIAGYDHGSHQGKIIGMVKGNAKSASVSVKVAVNIVNGAKQYIIYEENFIENPSEHNVNQEFQILLNEGYPVVYDYAMDNNNGGSNSILNAIISADRSIYDNKRFRDGMFPCLKNNTRDKVSRYNEWFKEHIDLKTGVRFKNPINSKEDGYKLYITDNCQTLIHWFEKQSWVRSGKKTNSNTQVRELRKFRDDTWDAGTYAIDTIEFDYRDTFKNVLRFWKLYGFIEKPDFHPSQVMNDVGLANRVISNLASRTEKRRTYG